MNARYSRSSRKDRIFRYQMRVYEAEMIEMRLQKEAILRKIGFPSDSKPDAIPNIPSIYRFVVKPGVLAVLKRVQEFLWTIGSLKSGLSKPISADSACSETAEVVPPPPLTKAASMPHPATLYVDITSTLRGHVGGGIERVCRRIAAELQHTSLAKPVALFDGRLKTIDLQGRQLENVALSSCDTYLILDSFWEPLEEYAESLRQARTSGARTALCIHDVIPLIYPGLVGEGVPAWFEQKLRTILPLVDVIVSVSRSSARQIRTALRAIGTRKRILWFYLGHDSFGQTAEVACLSPPAGKVRFVSVGTLEPKKGYDCALDAFDALWRNGHEIYYTIVGRPGWACAALINRIGAHAEFGQRLIWIDDASDEDVYRVLSDSHCYIQASIAEGFGLPIVEAAHLGLPVIASDISVFREIAGDNISYFPVCDSRGLEGRILQIIAERPNGLAIPALTWAQSAAGLLKALGIVSPHGHSSGGVSTPLK